MIATTAVPPADGAEHRFDPRWIDLQRTQGWLFTAAIAPVSLFGVTAGWIATGEPLLGVVFLPLWALAIAAIAWHLRRWPAIAYRVASYRVDGLGLEVKRGVFWRTVTHIPRSRVQHTDVSQGPLERRYGLGTLMVYTAGTAHSKVTVPGLDYAVAQAIRENLLPRDGGDAV